MADIVISSIADPAAYVDYYADSYSTDDSLSFYFIFLTENSVEISGTDNAVCVLALVCTFRVEQYFNTVIIFDYRLQIPLHFGNTVKTKPGENLKQTLQLCSIHTESFLSTELDIIDSFNLSTMLLLIDLLHSSIRMKVMHKQICICYCIVNA